MRETDDAILEIGLAASKVALSTAIPVIGPFLCEFMPNLRLERVRSLAAILRDRLDDLEARVAECEQDLNKADLLHEGCRQAAKAASQDRIHFLASVLAHGLTGNTGAQREAKRIMVLLDQITDEEIVVLASKSSQRHPMRNREFWERNKELLQPRSKTLNRPQHEHDDATIHESMYEHLAQLGLLEKSNAQYKITALGSLLLRRVESTDVE